MWLIVIIMGPVHVKCSIKRVICEKMKEYLFDKNRRLAIHTAKSISEFLCALLHREKPDVHGRKWWTFREFSLMSPKSIPYHSGWSITQRAKNITRFKCHRRGTHRCGYNVMWWSKINPKSQGKKKKKNFIDVSNLTCLKQKKSIIPLVINSTNSQFNLRNVSKLRSTQ